MTTKLLLCRLIWKIKEWAQRWRRSRRCWRLLVGCQQPFTEANVVTCLLSQTVNEIMALSLPITLRITQDNSVKLIPQCATLFCDWTFDLLSSALVKKKKKKTKTSQWEPNVQRFRQCFCAQLEDCWPRETWETWDNVAFARTRLG